MIRREPKKKTIKAARDLKKRGRPFLVLLHYPFSVFRPPKRRFPFLRF